MLIKEVNEQKVLTALLQFNGFKAHGPDRLKASFYNKFWKIVGRSICKWLKPSIIMNLT